MSTICKSSPTTDVYLSEDVTKLFIQKTLSAKRRYKHNICRFEILTFYAFIAWTALITANVAFLIWLQARLRWAGRLGRYASPF